MVVLLKKDGLHQYMRDREQKRVKKDIFICLRLCILRAE